VEGSLIDGPLTISFSLSRERSSQTVASNMILRSQRNQAF